MRPAIIALCILAVSAFAADSRARYDRVPPKFQDTLKAAYGPEHPSHSAQLTLGKNFLAGTNGFSRDPEAAAAWFYVAITESVHHDFRCRFYTWKDNIAFPLQSKASQSFLSDHARYQRAQELERELHDRVWGKCDTKSGKTFKKQGIP